MAQYDLHISQNVAPSGVEFTERKVNLAKGALLSADASSVPTILAVGTDGYMLVADAASATGLKWQAISAGHTQGTDMGTTSTVFGIDTDGYDIELTAESASKLGVKVNGGATYADIQAKDATFNKVSVSTAPSAGTDLTNKTYVDGLLSANDAMVFKGTVGTSGTYEIAAFNALATYQAGWAYSVKTAGTIKGQVCEISDLLVAIIDRSGSGNLDADWIVLQTNKDGIVTGPASATDGYLALFDGITGKLIKAGTGAPGTMAYETATNYVPKSLFDAYSMIYADTDNTPAMLSIGASTFVGRKATGGVSAMSAAEAKAVLALAAGDIPDLSATYVTKALYDANTILYATTDNTPAALTVGASTIVGRKATGNIVALTPADIMSVILVAAPAAYNSTGVAGQIACDGNYWYHCYATNSWRRTPLATNWT